MTKSQIKLIMLSCLGGALEFFDFVIYALFATYIGKAFFSSSDYISTLINTYAVFAFGYFGRPIGSLIFGHLGDRFGRKYAFTIAAFMMACSTFLIGCLPTYQQIGLTASILLILLRIIQGVSLGGEIGGATVFVAEHMTKEKRGLAVGLFFMAVSFGNVIGSLLGYMLAHLFDQATLYSWGWRIPFWLGFILSIVSYSIRLKTLETPEFTALTKAQKYKLPAMVLIRQHFPQLLIGISLTALPGATFALLMYLPNYLALVAQLSASQTYFNNSIAFIIVSIFTGFFGFLSDYIGRKALIICGSSLIMCFSYFIFQLAISSNSLLLFDVCLAFFAAILNGCYACAITEQFDTRVRYTGTAFSFNVGITIFSGITPLASILLYNATHDLFAPTFFLISCAMINLIGGFAIKNNFSEQPVSVLVQDSLRI